MRNEIIFHNDIRIRWPRSKEDRLLECLVSFAPTIKIEGNSNKLPELIIQGSGWSWKGLPTFYLLSSEKGVLGVEGLPDTGKLLYGRKNPTGGCIPEESEDFPPQDSEYISIHLPEVGPVKTFSQGVKGLAVKVQRNLDQYEIGEKFFARRGKDRIYVPLTHKRKPTW